MGMCVRATYHLKTEFASRGEFIHVDPCARCGTTRRQTLFTFTKHTLPADTPVSTTPVATALAAATSDAPATTTLAAAAIDADTIAATTPGSINTRQREGQGGKGERGSQRRCHQQQGTR